jgi:hypothetical protein
MPFFQNVQQNCVGRNTRHHGFRLPIEHLPLDHQLTQHIPILADEAEAPQPKIEHKERVHGDSYPILNHATSAENADTSGECPGNENQVDWDPCGDREVEDRE